MANASETAPGSYYSTVMRGALTSFATARTSVMGRYDAWVNELTGFGSTRDKTTYGTILPDRILVDEELSALYHSDDMSARMIDIVPEEMMREGFGIGTGLPDLDATIDDKLEDIGAPEHLVEGMRWGRCYGGGALVLGCDDGQSADLPLIPEKANDLSYLYVADRRMLWPMSYYEKSGPKMGRPETYAVTTYGGRTLNQSIIHESRLVLFRGAPTGIREKLMLASWDYSVMQRAYDVLRSFNTGWKAVENLLTDGNQAIFKMTGLAEMLRTGSGGSGQRLLRERMLAMDMMRSVVRALVIDADGKETFERQSTNFSNIPETLDKFMLRLAAAVQIPVTILMGQSPAGMNATGDSDFRWFYDRIKSQQKTMLAPKIRRIVAVWLRTKAGSAFLKAKKLKGVDVNFPNLWTDPPLIQAQRRYAIAQGDALYATSQSISPEALGLARFAPDGKGFEKEIALTKEAVEAYKAAIEVDLDKLSGSDAENETTDIEETPTSDIHATSDLLKLTPSDVAAIVKVNEARASVGLPPLPGKDGNLTLPQFKAKYATVIAAAANADDGTTDDGSGKPHPSTVGVQEKKPEPKPPQFGGPPNPGAPPSGAAPTRVGESKAPAFTITTKDPQNPNAPEEKLDAVRLDAMRCFEMHREIDETGVSGTGHVADGVEFEDGKIALRWRTKTASTTFFDTMADVHKVHGHAGKTTIKYIPLFAPSTTDSPAAGDGGGQIP